MNLKYTAIKVDEIEKSKGMAIENCIGDATIDNLVLFVQKGLVDDNGVHGVSRSIALTKIDEYLAKKDKQELVLDIIEALIAGGFLPRTLDVEGIRVAMKEATQKANEGIKESLPHSEKNGEL